MIIVRTRWASLSSWCRAAAAHSVLLACTGAAALASLVVSVPTVWSLVEDQSYAEALQAGILMTIATVLLCVGVVRRTRAGLRTRTELAVLLGAQALVTLTPFFWLGPHWQGADMLLGWLILIVVRPPWSWLFFLAIVARSALMWITENWTLNAYAAVVMLLSGFLLQSLLRIGDLAGKLSQARNYIATLAVADARAEMSRDLHDGLGHSLVSISLRAELAERLAEQDPPATRRELREVREIADEALRDMRAVVQGARKAGFDRELAGATGLLEAIGTRCEVQVAGPPDADAEETLGWVLREAVTNIVRHSEASFCTIVLGIREDHFCLTITNDGAHGESISHGGQGLEDLSARVRERGGSLTVERLDDRFTLQAAIPCAARTTPVPELEGAGR